MKNLLNNKIVVSILLLVIGIFLGWIFFAPTTTSVEQVEEHQHTTETWTCSMHPSVRQSEPGKCPICGMDLIPLQTEENDKPMEVSMSATAIKLANIQTTIIGVGQATKEIRLNGKVQPDERKISSQAAHIPGRIEQLLVNYTGEFVQRGSVIAYVYSPELITAQQELFEAFKIKDSQPALYNAAKEKLKNWKLTDSQIDGMINSKKPTERFPILADVSGVLSKRNVNVGDYVMRGMPIYDVVDLSRVWVLFDVYETEMPWVKKNSTIEFTVQSLPGEKFTSQVTFIDPVIDPKTRVAKARVELSNSGLKLKPEMFATGLVKTALQKESKIIIPKSAVMWTGERSIVYLKKTSDNGASFLLQEVTLGPSLGESYVIEKGLDAGMEIVTNGTFTIDAAAQLAGKPSMMNPESENSSTTSKQTNNNSNTTSKSNDVNKIFVKQLMEVYHAYLSMEEAYVSSDAANVSSSVKSVEDLLKKVDMKLVEGELHMHWMDDQKMLTNALQKIKATNEIEAQRMAFSDFSDALYSALDVFGTTGETIYHQYCPMAKDGKGAYWLSNEKEIKNPYYGNAMLTCGETKDIIKK